MQDRTAWRYNPVMIIPCTRISRCSAFLLCWLLLAACGDETSVPTQHAAQSPTAEQVSRQNRLLTGREVYGEFCASCHDTGLQGAPVIGNPADWEGRSQLWQAVLMEHAEAGYLDMPARGGAAELPELSVSYAVEYMMLETFPEKLPD